MGARALHDFTAQLPVRVADAAGGERAFRAVHAGGDQSGIACGVRGAVRELLERTRRRWGSWPHVVATGGDARRLVRAAELVDSFVPDLVLQGAALAWEHERE